VYHHQATMGMFMTQLLTLLSTLPPENVFVSIYESGSTDSTPAWLTLLGGMLTMLEVRQGLVAPAQRVYC
jgi:hypothetical protein